MFNLKINFNHLKINITSDLLRKCDESFINFMNSPVDVTISPQSFNTLTSTYISFGGSKSFLI